MQIFTLNDDLRHPPHIPPAKGSFPSTPQFFQPLAPIISVMQGVITVGIHGPTWSLWGLLWPVMQSNQRSAMNERRWGMPHEPTSSTWEGRKSRPPTLA
jgi:hypothetical protein